MGAAAEVDEFPLPIKRQGRVGGQAGLDVLNLERLLEITHDLHGLLARHLDPLKRLVGLDDLLHLSLDQRQIVVGDRPAGPHVVIKAFADGGAEGQLDVRKEPRHGAGHDVGGGVPHHRQRPRIAGGEPVDRSLASGGQRRIESHRLAVEQRRDRPLLPRAFLDRLGDDVAHPRGLRKLVDDAIGKTNSGHDMEGPQMGWNRGSRFQPGETQSRENQSIDGAGAVRQGRSRPRLGDHPPPKVTTARRRRRSGCAARPLGHQAACYCQPRSA